MIYEDIKEEKLRSGASDKFKFDSLASGTLQLLVLRTCVTAKSERWRCESVGRTCGTKP